jgi:hypothetical protein
MHISYPSRRLAADQNRGEPDGDHAAVYRHVSLSSGGHGHG